MPSVSTLASLPRNDHHSTRDVSYANQLRKEFKAPFAVVDVARMCVLYVPDDFPAEITEPDYLPLVRRVCSREQVELQDSGRWQLVGLPVWKSEQVSMVATGAFRSGTGEVREYNSQGASQHSELAPATSFLVAYPAYCLQHWAQAVADRQRLNDKVRTKSRQCDSLEQELGSSGKMLQVLDRLAGRLRIADRPEKFQKLALTALFETISTECLAWVPSNPHDSVSLMGQSVIDQDRMRRLVLAAIAHGEPASRRCSIENRVPETVWGMDLPLLRSIAIVSADEERPSGWLVAVNKNADSGFSLNDTTLMRPIASLLNVYHKNLNLYVDLKELLFGVVRALTSAIDAKDPYTRGHSERVARIAVCLGREMMLGTEDLSNLYLAGLLHDVGKIGVDDQVLKKADRLTPEEYRHVMSHVEIGVSILRELKRLRHVLPGILHHHERFAGGGYPDGIKGDEIPLIARILAVADSFDAMSSDRPYRPRRTADEVSDILRDGASMQWDPKAVEAALACWYELCAIQQRGLGESLRVAVDEALHQDYPAPDPSKVST